MKRFFLTAAALLLFATPAHALKITNLDSVPHTVELAGRGTVSRYVIPPDATENITGASQGFLSLISAPVKQKAKGVLEADGLLSGVIAASRNQEIPVDPNDIYVIWPGGDLRLQGKIKPSGMR
jgi:hypothetical protein